MHMYVWPLREVKSDRCLMCVGQVYYVWAGGGLVGAAAAIRWQLLWVTNLDRLPFRATFTPGFTRAHGGSSSALGRQARALRRERCNV